MGEVWLATHATLDRRVALKLLPSELGGDPRFRTRFLAQSRTVRWTPSFRMRCNGAARTFPSSSAPREPSGGPGRTPCAARGTFHLAGRTGWEIDWTHAIDIDTEDDWRLADALMGRS